MAKIGFWEGLFGDVGHYERNAINDNAEGLSMMMEAQYSNAAHNAKQMRKLYALDHAQSKELARLRTMVRVLSDVVIELGFDRDRLANIMEDALDVLESEKTMTEGSYGPDGSPYRGGGAEAQKAEPKTTCDRCHKEVLLRRTNITEWGTTCDACFDE